MATLGRWTGGSTALIPTTAWTAPNGLFPTQDRNDTSAYSFTSSTSTITLPSSNLANGYLVIARVDHNGSGNRVQPNTRISYSGTGNFVSAYGVGYGRDNNNNNPYTQCFGFIDNPSASDTLQFQWKRDTDSAITGTNRSSIDVIPLYYSDAGIYSSTSTSIPGGTTPNQVTGFSTVLEGTNITRSTDTVTIAGDNKRYFCIGGLYTEGIGNARTQRWAGFRVDGTKEDSMKGYCYARNSGNDRIGINWMGLVETSTADRTLDMFVYLGDGVASDQGGADVAANTTGSACNHVMVVLELEDSAQTLWSTNVGGTQQNLHSTTNSNLQVANTVDFNDAASFTKTSDTQVNAEVNMDALLISNVSAASFQVGSGARGEFFTEATVNDIENTDIFHGNYIRGNQGTQDTFGWSSHTSGFLSLTTGDDVGISVSGSGDSHNTRTQLGWTGFGLLNLDTLEGGAPPITPRRIITIT
jgi:hypothetical protein